MGRPLWIVAALLVSGLVVINTAVHSDAIPPGQPGVIAFASDRDGDFDIWTVDPSFETTQKLFDTAQDERYPAWSPDGAKLAFVRTNVSSPCSANSSCDELWVRTVATGAETRLVPGVVNGFVYTPAWSPDGSKIAYVARDSVNARDVWIVPATGGTVTRVTSGSASELSPDWSPDGSQLVFSISGALYTVSSSATNGSPAPAALSMSGTVPGHAREPSWAPDGRIAFFGGANAFTLGTLYVTSFNGSGTSAVWSSGTATLSNPGWASDAGKIAFVLIPDSGIKGDLRVYDPCSGQASAVATSTADDLDPAWRPSLPAPSTMPPACPSASPSTPTTTAPSTSTTTASLTTTTTTSAPSPTTATTTTTTSSPSPTTATTTTTTSAPPPTTTTTRAPSPTTATTTTTTSSPPPTTTTTSAPPPTPPPGTVVLVEPSTFDPEVLEVRRGGTVVWDNVDVSTRRIVDGSGLALFDLLLAPDGFGAHSFVGAGRYRFADADLPLMAGTVSVPVAARRVKGSPSTADVTWASRNAPDGYAYDVQVRRPGGKWRVWLDHATRATASFRIDSDGTYRFRSRMLRLVDLSHARWSVDDAIRVGS